MQLFVLGLNHKTAPLALREKLAFPAEVLPEALQALKGIPAIREVVLLSTCNRTEIYCIAADVEDLQCWLKENAQMAEVTLQNSVYIFSGLDAVKHVFRVASGLDSMVLGEPQILGQLKSAVRIADQVNAMSTLLNGFFQQTFAAAKEVRSRTMIGNHSVSMAAATVKLAEQVFPELAQTHILFIGAGEMITLVARYFALQKPEQISVANRTLERGLLLTQQIGVASENILLADVPQRLHEYDIVVSCTASTLPLIGKGLIERVMRQRAGRPVLIFDLAVPRDVEPEVSDISHVTLYCIDDLASVVEIGKEARAIAAKQAEEMINDRVRMFDRWLKKREVVPTIRALRDEAERIRRHALKKAQRQLIKGVSPEQVIEQLSLQLTNKLVHPPTQALASSNGKKDEMVDSITRLYRLNRSKA